MLMDRHLLEVTVRLPEVGAMLPYQQLLLELYLASGGQHRHRL